jgi:hypothetical protein
MAALAFCAGILLLACFRSFQRRPTTSWDSLIQETVPSPWLLPWLPPGFPPQAIDSLVRVQAELLDYSVNSVTGAAPLYRHRTAVPPFSCTAAPPPAPPGHPPGGARGAALPPLVAGRRSLTRG